MEPVKKEDLFKALTEIDDDLVKNACEYGEKRAPKRKTWLYIGAFAAVFLTALIVIPLINGKLNRNGDGYPSGVKKVLAAYPTPLVADSSGWEYYESSEFNKWQKDRLEKMRLSEGTERGLYPYCMNIMQELLGNGDDSAVCSPVNMYIAFSMLAEVTDGNTRRQILDMLGVSDVQALRNNIKAIWESNYNDSPLGTCVLANSIWLSDDSKYVPETLNTLAEQYYASSFYGRPGTEAFDEALRHWVDENTKGLLSDYVKDFKSDEKAILEILSTLYYKAVWTSMFKAEETTKGTFHGRNGDTVSDMMHRYYMGDAYGSDKFTAISLGLSDNARMFFFLPDEGVEVEELLYDTDVFMALNHDTAISEGLYNHCIITLSLPKFKVSAKTDLVETMKKLGITDAFDKNISDFTPLTTESDEIYVSQAEHAALLEIDEDGVKGAAYTAIEAANESLPNEKLDITFDRPFLFILKGYDGSILFAGVVRNIEED